LLPKDDPIYQKVQGTAIRERSYYLGQHLSQTMKKFGEFKRKSKARASVAAFEKAVQFERDNFDAINTQCSLLQAFIAGKLAEKENEIEALVNAHLEKNDGTDFEIPLDMRRISMTYDCYASEEVVRFMIGKDVPKNCALSIVGSNPSEGIVTVGISLVIE
jgi:hypothetical protein